LIREKAIEAERRDYDIEGDFNLGKPVLNRMKGRRQAVMQTRIQSNRRVTDEVHLDPDLFQPRVSWDWYGQPHRTMVVFRNSKLAYLFLVAAAFALIWVVGWAIVVALHP